MSNDIDPDIEQRVASALSAIADAHQPVARPIGPARQPSTRRWVLGVAAAAVVAVGVGSLLIASNRDTERSADRLPGITASTPSTSGATTSGTEPELVVDFMSDEPLAPDVVPILDPAPSGPASGFDLGESTESWAFGVENTTMFAVLDGDSVAGVIQVFDSAAPWDALTENEQLADLDGLEAIRVEEDPAVGYFVQVGDRSRAAFGEPTSSEDAPLDGDMATLLRLLGDAPIDQFESTERLVRVPLDRTVGLGVSFGDRQALQLLRLRLETDAPGGSVELVAKAYQASVARNDSSQVSTLVQVSPVDVIVVVANDDEQLAEARAALRLVDRAESGINFEQLGVMFTGIDEVRGEPSWGRWSVSRDPNDPDCRLFQVLQWDVRGTGRGFSDCGERNSVRTDGSRVFCSRFELETAIVVVGTETEPIIAVGPDIDGLAVETDFVDGATSARIVQAVPGANVRASTVLLDGAEVNCDG